MVTAGPASRAQTARQRQPSDARRRRRLRVHDGAAARSRPATRPARWRRSSARSKLDPQSAEISAEIAGYYFRPESPDRRRGGRRAGAQARQGQRRGAQHSRHRVLGVDRRRRAAAAGADARRRRAPTAIEHLTAIQNTPLMATNPNLQMTLGRLQLRAGKADLAVPILEKVAQQAPWAAEAAAAAVRSADLAGQDRRSGAVAGPGRGDQSALLRAARPVLRAPGQVGRVPPPAYEEAIASSRQPSRDLQMRYAAALINTEGGGAKARGSCRSAQGQPERHARPLHAVDRRAYRRATTRLRKPPRARSSPIDPTNVAGLRALVAVLFDRFDFKQIVEVVTPLVKDPSRAKGREFEGAAVLVQLGIAQQQLAQWDGSIAAFTAAKSLTPDDPEIDAYLVQANLTARRFDRAEAVAREALARNPDQPRMVRLRAQALLKARQDRRSQQAARRRRGQAARQPRVSSSASPISTPIRSAPTMRCGARTGAQDVWRRRGADHAHGQCLRRPAAAWRMRKKNCAA